jgi:UDP-4-amino-4-deoxy-L-arabinose formyltransferase/UDP-glucuronic acid dehydrogenase (UDP-4-keto-hexauronic acid decarboxylating)
VTSVLFAYQQVGWACLKALLEAGGRPALLVTHEDDPNEEVWFQSAAQLAEEHGVPVVKPGRPDEPEVVRQVRSIAPDFIFSFYYRRLLPPAVLSAARKGAYNLHGSLLPKYRGKAPVNWALVHGETETGVTLHRMTPRPDDGPIVAQKAVPIAKKDTIREVYAKIVAAAAELVAEVYPLLAAGRIEETPQDESRATYFGGRTPADGRIDWTRPAIAVYNLVRAVTHPYPGAFTTIDGRTLFIWSATDAPQAAGGPPGTVLGLDPERGLAVACGQGVLYVTSAQWAGESEIRPPDLGRLGLAPGRIFDQ